MGDLIIKINKKTFAVKLEGEGFNGTDCVVEADALQAALGMVTLTDSPKEDTAFLVGVDSVHNTNG